MAKEVQTPVEKKAKKVAPKAVPARMAPVYTDGGKKMSDMPLLEELFGVVASPRLLSLYVRVYQNHQYSTRGTTKTRAEVQGSTRKIYRQKGTGRARHGDARAPIFVGGGVTHGPIGLRKSLKMNKKQRVKALLYSLSLKAAQQSISILDFSPKFGSKTKEIVSFFAATSFTAPQLIICSSKEERDMLSGFNNVQKAHLALAVGVNAFQVMNAKSILFTKSGYDAFVSSRTGVEK